MTGLDQRAGIYIISSSRPLNVHLMAAHLEQATAAVTWVVPADQARTYTEAGANAILPVAEPPGGGWMLPRARNAALDHAEDRGLICFQLDDDLRGLYTLDEHRARARASWPQIQDALTAAVTGPRAPYLAGVAPTSNPLSARHTRSDWGFVVGCLTATRPGSGIRFDTGLGLKEDYDYTCAHLERHGHIARLNWIFADFAHYRNRGGAVAYRTPALEAETTARLLERWPTYLKPHPKRVSELAFRPRPRDRARSPKAGAR